MTIENRQFLSLDEIIAVHFRCSNKECQARLALSPASWSKLPRHCPSCGGKWWLGHTEPDSESIENALRSLQQSITILVEAQNNRVSYREDSEKYIGCDVTLEFDAFGLDAIGKAKESVKTPRRKG